MLASVSPCVYTVCAVDRWLRINQHSRNLEDTALTNSLEPSLGGADEGMSLVWGVWPSPHVTPYWT